MYIFIIIRSCDNKAQNWQRVLRLSTTWHAAIKFRSCVSGRWIERLRCTSFLTWHNAKVQLALFGSRALRKTTWPAAHVEIWSFTPNSKWNCCHVGKFNFVHLNVMSHPSGSFVARSSHCLATGYMHVTCPIYMYMYMYVQSCTITSCTCTCTCIHWTIIESLS